MRFQVCFNANLAWMEQTFEMSTTLQFVCFWSDKRLSKESKFPIRVIYVGRIEHG